MTAGLCERCDAVAIEDGLCRECLTERDAPWPNDEWPEGVAWEDLPDEWADYFESLAWDWPPVHCGVVTRRHFTSMTSELCVKCGLLIG